MMTKQIIAILRKEKLLSKKDFSDLRDFERASRGNILDFCADRNILPSPELMRLLQKDHAIPVVDLNEIQIDQDCIRLLPSSVCTEHLVLPFYRDDQDILYVATARPSDPALLSFMKEKTGKHIALYFTHESTLRQTLERLFNVSTQDSHASIVDLISRAQLLSHEPEAMAQETPIIALLNQLIIFALRSKASDMHVEPQEDGVILRFRVDGLLHEFFKLPTALLAPLTARIKIVSQLRIDEFMRPQDGRFKFVENDYDVAVRVSVLPTLHGPKTTLRFLDTKNNKLSLDSLGLYPVHRKQIEEAMNYSNGIILVTGPTGSGKTTTLYAMVKEIMKRKINVSTIEDPIEYHLKGASQVQVNLQADLTFANGLRAMLRQDPDIIMIGEIRDKETAMIAVNAALTGHLVLSSLHTNSASAAIPRLLDMGIEPYLLSSTLRAVIGQRLVRRVCERCKTISDVDVLPFGLAAYVRTEGSYSIAQGSGCAECLRTGYLGRSGIFEILVSDDTIRSFIIKRSDANMIERAAQDRGMKVLAEDGMSKVADGITTPEEIGRVVF